MTVKQLPLQGVKPGYSRVDSNPLGAAKDAVHSAAPSGERQAPSEARRRAAVGRQLRQLPAVPTGFTA